MCTGSARGLLTAAMAGAGITLLPAPFAPRRETLVELGPHSPLPSWQPWLLVNRDLRGLPAIRLTQKWVAEPFASLPDSNNASQSMN